MSAQALKKRKKPNYTVSTCTSRCKLLPILRVCNTLSQSITVLPISILRFCNSFLDCLVPGDVPQSNESNPLSKSFAQCARGFASSKSVWQNPFCLSAILPAVSGVWSGTQSTSKWLREPCKGATTLRGPLLDGLHDKSAASATLKDLLLAPRNPTHSRAPHSHLEAHHRL